MAPMASPAARAPMPTSGRGTSGSLSASLSPCAPGRRVSRSIEITRRASSSSASRPWLHHCQRRTRRARSRGPRSAALCGLRSSMRRAARASSAASCSACPRRGIRSATGAATVRTDRWQAIDDDDILRARALPDPLDAMALAFAGRAVASRRRRSVARASGRNEPFAFVLTTPSSRTDRGARSAEPRIGRGTGRAVAVTASSRRCGFSADRGAGRAGDRRRRAVRRHARIAQGADGASSLKARTLALWVAENRLAQAQPTTRRRAAGHDDRRGRAGGHAVSPGGAPVRCVAQSRVPQDRDRRRARTTSPATCSRGSSATSAAGLTRDMTRASREPSGLHARRGARRDRDPRRSSRSSHGARRRRWPTARRGSLPSARAGSSSSTPYLTRVRGGPAIVGPATGAARRRRPTLRGRWQSTTARRQMRLLVFTRAGPSAVRRARKRRAAHRLSADAAAVSRHCTGRTRQRRHAEPRRAMR